MDNNFDWFRVDNLEPQLRYGYPSRVDNEIYEADEDWNYYGNLDLKDQRILSVFDELRENLGRHHDDNKIVIGYKRKDNGEMVYVGWKDSLRHIGPAAHNRDGAEPTRPWDI